MAERIPEMNPQFAKNWFLRCRQLIDDYNPDLIYFDDEHDLPLEHYGLEIAAHMYNRSMRMHGGRNEAVINAKRLSEEQQRGVVMDCERGAFADISPRPWQTCMCIGSWHYDRKLYEKGRYKTVERVVKTFVDIVSKNGNLLLNIPVRGDGSIDEKERAFLKDFRAWLDVNGEGIFGTRPWKVYGEGAVNTANTGSFRDNEKLQESLSDKDIRYTQKNGTLYAFVLASASSGSACWAAAIKWRSARRPTPSPSPCRRSRIQARPSASQFSRSPLQLPQRGERTPVQGRSRKRQRYRPNSQTPKLPNSQNYCLHSYTPTLLHSYTP